MTASVLAFLVALLRSIAHAAIRLAEHVGLRRLAAGTVPHADPLPPCLHGLRYRAWSGPRRELLYVQGRCKDVTGYSAEELLEGSVDSLSDLIHPRDREHVEAQIEKALETEGSYQINYRIRSKNGSWKWVTDRGDASRSEGDDLVGVEGVLLDISDRVAAELARVRAEERYHLLAAHVEDLICVHDGDGRLTYATPSAKQLLGYDPGEITGKSFYVMMHPDDGPRVRRQIERRVREDGESLSLSYRLRRKDGRYIRLETHCKPAQDRRGYYTRFVTTSRDVTERSRLERELSELRGGIQDSGAQESFLTNVTHEFRTPLSSIIGFAELLKEEVAEGQRQALETISQSGEQLLSTLTSVLEYSAAGAAPAEGRRKRTNVVPPVVAEVERYRKVAREKEITLQLVTDSDHVYALADQDAVSRIADQLLSNAVKFTRPGGCVTAAVLEDAGHALLRVSDTGIGISESFLPRIFEPFRQESSGLAKKYEGVGIGLALVNRLAEGFGGRISVDSTPGKGSVFSVRLPSKAEAPAGSGADMEDGASLAAAETADSTEAAQAPQKAAAQAARAKKRILAVDDNEPMRLILKRHLRDAFEVETAADGDEALDLASHEQFDVVVLDINLGTKKSGIDVLQEIRRVGGYDEAPVIAITAYALPEEKSRFLKAGFDGYVAKPFTRESLLREVGRVTQLRMESAAAAKRAEAEGAAAPTTLNLRKAS